MGALAVVLSKVVFFEGHDTDPALEDHRSYKIRVIVVAIRCTRSLK
jgi:hypothetical protein